MSIGVAVGSYGLASAASGNSTARRRLDDSRRDRARRAEHPEAVRRPAE